MIFQGGGGGLDPLHPHLWIRTWHNNSILYMQVLISVPTQKQRKDILLSHLSELPVASDLNIDYLSDVTNGYVGADLAALCHEAAYIAMNEMGPRSHAEESKVYLCLNKGIIFRPPDKSAYWKIIFFISHPKYMLLAGIKLGGD